MRAAEIRRGYFANFMAGIRGLLYDVCYVNVFKTTLCNIGMI